MSKKKFDSEDISTFLSSHLHVPTRTLFIGEYENPAPEQLEQGMTAFTVEKYIKALIVLNHLSPTEEIRIVVNSPGGDVIEGFALIDYLESIQNPIKVEVYGKCFSMAVALLQIAQKRLISPRAAVLIHDGQSISSGYNRNSKKNWDKFLSHLDNWYEDLLLNRIKEKHPTFTKKKLQSMTQHDTILTAEEAVELGLADEVI